MNIDGELKKSEPDEIEKLILSWRDAAVAQRKMRDQFKADSLNYGAYDASADAYEACARELEAAYIGPDPSGDAPIHSVVRDFANAFLQSAVFNLAAEFGKKAANARDTRACSKCGAAIGEWCKSMDDKIAICKERLR